ncbi:MAG: hypothetical protein K8L97_00050 [Anaerolineae bacterium]|nr:hypothetical protein [Anaerolineae bacterium]
MTIQPNESIIQQIFDDMLAQLEKDELFNTQLISELKLLMNKNQLSDPKQISHIIVSLSGETTE